MALDLTAVGPEHPSTSTPRLVAGGVRRTSSIDTRRPTAAEPARGIDARARDVRADPSGPLVEVGATRVHASVDPSTYELTAIDTQPADPRLRALVGAGVMTGWRRRLGQVLDHDDDPGSLLLLLLDDLTGAQLVAGYDTVSAEGGVPRRHDPERVAVLLSRADQCAGWVDGGTLIGGIRADAAVPLHVGPAAPVLEPPDDPDAWHAMAPLADGGMRRRRRLDLHPSADGRHPFEAHFRDSHCSDADGETILHEYRVRGVVDAPTRTLVELTPEALVLPYPECPSALAHTTRIAGARLADLRRTVNRELTGTSSCTHLNDVLRSLADLDRLLALLP